MPPFLEIVSSALAGNPYFSAGAGLIGVGTGMAALRAGWRGVNFYARRNYVLSLEIPSRDRSYFWVQNWLSHHNAFSTQHLSVETSFEQMENGDVKTQTLFVPNVGNHFINFQGRLIKLERSREKNVVDMASGSLWESITLTTIGQDRQIFSDILNEARKLALQKEEGRTVIYSSGGGEWHRLGFPRRRRPLHSVILDQGLTDELLNDIREFVSKNAWYMDRGIPYRRGYLLHGPPGCGKSSFIYALAGELGLNICILNLNAKGINDDVLNTLLINAPQRSIILLEDIDAVLPHGRATGSTTLGVTFSGLLNALDGVAATEGRITFMTTNHIEKLDPALIRPGRVDVIRKLDHATTFQVKQLYERFYPGHPEAAALFAAHVPPHTVSMAYLQNYFMAFKDNPDGAVQNAHMIMQKSEE